MAAEQAAVPAVEIQATRSLALFLDVNETLIRTGEVSADDRLKETRELTAFVAACASLAERTAGLRVVLLTGNSFEYTRRVEEPLGLKNLTGVEVVIVSENGLLARSFDAGDLWTCQLTPAYADAASEILRSAAEQDTLAGRYYSQGNELRTTLKPVANRFSTGELQRFEALIQPAVDSGVLVAYLHPYYLDLDPSFVRLDGEELAFDGKYFATQRLARSWSRSQYLAVGDSASDLPMFDAVRACGGSGFLVANASPELTAPGVARLGSSFAAGVVELLRNLVVVTQP